MDFLVCQCCLQGLQIHIPLEDIKDEDEAISKARAIALHTKEGAVVGLFTRDAHAIFGWKVMKGGKLRREPIEEIQFKCGATPETFELAKREAEKLRKAHENKC